MAALRVKRGVLVPVLRVHMDSPMEVILGVAALGGVAYGLVIKLLDIRNLAASSNAHVAEMDADAAAHRVRQALAEAVEKELRDTGLSATVLLSKEMEQVVDNTARVLQHVAKLEIEQ